MVMFIIQEIVRTAVLAFALLQTIILIQKWITLFIISMNNEGSVTIKASNIYSVAIGWAVVFVWQFYTPFGNC
jgi:hypothetical protein